MIRELLLFGNTKCLNNLCKVTPRFSEWNSSLRDKTRHGGFIHSPIPRPHDTESPTCEKLFHPIFLLQIVYLNKT
jgi:hypothetical protein